MDSDVKGNSLKGWTAFGDHADKLWQVRDGVLHSDARALQVKANWLRFDLELDHFEFECEVFSSNTDGNSGIQVRSRYPNGVIKGPQVDVDPATGWRTGLVYDETDHCWITPKKQDWRIEAKEGAKYWRWNKNEWNRIRIRCEGDKIMTWVNSIPIANYDDAKKGYLNKASHHHHKVGKSGYIFLQQHAHSHLNIQFRKLRYRKLDLKKAPVHKK